MAFLDLTEETWLDLTVNLIPLGILAFMDALFWFFNPWGWDPLMIAVSHFLTLFPILVLAILSYVSGSIIQREEERSVDVE